MIETMLMWIVVVGAPWAYAQTFWALTRQRLGTIDEIAALVGVFVGWGVVVSTTVLLPA